MLKWLDNFWYHHKWAVIITVFFVVVAIICTIQLANRTQYDAYFELIGNGGSITKTQHEDIISSLSRFVGDCDDNGEVSVLFSREVFISDENDVVAGVLNSNVTTFMREALYQDYFIFFIDPVLYESYKESGMFVPLENHVGPIPEEMMYDECAIKLSSCKITELPGISSIPENSLIVLKTVPYSASNKKMTAMQSFQDIHAEIIKKIVAYGVIE